MHCHTFVSADDPAPECQRAGGVAMSGGCMDVRDLPPITDDEIVGMWRIAADDAASHKASVCGEQGGRCKHRRANLDECDGLLDVWLSRHGRP